MPVPLVLPLLALGAANIASQYLSGKKQDEFQKSQVAQQRLDARRAAIERAMGGTSITRNPDPIKPPDLSNYGAAAGLAQLGSSLYAQKYLTPGA